ncbi:MAG TPA: hypothetical protein VIJ25_10060, partial [Methylococcales bacterium]
MDGSPTGGAYKLDNAVLSGGSFDPASVSLGSHTITYSYGGACPVTSANENISIVVAATVSITNAPASICVNGAPINLSTDNGTLTNGSFSGPGTSISGTTFTPSLAGSTGNQTISYSAKDNNQCTCSTSATINIKDKPSVSLSLPSVCLDSDPFSLSGGSPAPGSYSGPGVTNNQFDPAGLSAGPENITYAYRDPSTTCSNTKTAALTILNVNKPPLPLLSNNLNQIMCKGTSQTLQVTNQGNYTVNWYGANGGSTLSSSSATYLVKGFDKDTSLLVQYTDGNNCVSKIKNVSILIDSVKADFTVPASVKQGSKANMTNLSSTKLGALD